MFILFFIISTTWIIIASTASSNKRLQNCICMVAEFCQSLSPWGRICVIILHQQLGSIIMIMVHNQRGFVESTLEVCRRIHIRVVLFSTNTVRVSKRLPLFVTLTMPALHVRFVRDSFHYLPHRGKNKTQNKYVSWIKHKTKTFIGRGQASLLMPVNPMREYFLGNLLRRQLRSFERPALFLSICRRKG